MITGDQLPFNSAPVVLTRQSHDDMGRTSIYNMKETIIPSSHKRIIEQTPQSYGVITPENQKVITGDQLPFDEVSMRQFRDGREEAFNDNTNKYTPTQTQLTNETSTSESCTLKDPQLPLSPVNVRLSTPNKEIKRNVQFHTPENDRDQRNSVKRIYDPILITPRHQNNNPSPNISSQEIRKEPPPYPPLNPNGRYFSGMVENGKGGDFFGYYYTSSPKNEVPESGKPYPFKEGITSPTLSQTQNYPQTTLYNRDLRNQDAYPMPLQ